MEKTTSIHQANRAQLFDWCIKNNVPYDEAYYDRLPIETLRVVILDFINLNK